MSGVGPPITQLEGSHAGSWPECCFVQHVEGTAGEAGGQSSRDWARLGKTGAWALERAPCSGNQLKNLKVSKQPPGQSVGQAEARLRAAAARLDRWRAGEKIAHRALGNRPGSCSTGSWILPDGGPKCRSQIAATGLSRSRVAQATEAQSSLGSRIGCGVRMRRRERQAVRCRKCPHQSDSASSARLHTGEHALDRPWIRPGAGATGPSASLAAESSPRGPHCAHLCSMPRAPGPTPSCEGFQGPREKPRSPTPPSPTPCTRQPSKQTSAKVKQTAQAGRQACSPAAQSVLPTRPPPDSLQRLIALPFIFLPDRSRSSPKTTSSAVGGTPDLYVESLMRDGTGERAGPSLGSASLGARVDSTPKRPAWVCEGSGQRGTLV